MIKTISTDKAPAAIGPYSQAKIAGDTLYASGQIPINPKLAAACDAGLIELYEGDWLDGALQAAMR